MSPTSIILCMAACFVGLVAALIVVNRFGSMSTRKLVVIAMMVAVYVVLNTVGTIRLGWINISVSALPIIVGALLYGPGGGLMVGLVGAFLGQLMTYGVTATPCCGSSRPRCAACSSVCTPSAAAMNSRASSSSAC